MFLIPAITSAVVVCYGVLGCRGGGAAAPRVVAYASISAATAAMVAAPTGGGRRRGYAAAAWQLWPDCGVERTSLAPLADSRGTTPLR